jgi:hypothetical protein
MPPGSVVRKVFHVSAELQTLMHDQKKTCDATDYHAYALAIAATIDRMNVELLDRTLARSAYSGILPSAAA